MRYRRAWAAVVALAALGTMAPATALGATIPVSVNDVGRVGPVGVTGYAPPAGLWERAWGLDVVSGGGTGFEICTAAASCKTGVDVGETGGALPYSTGAAVGPTGDVFVANSMLNRIDKYDGQGHFLLAFGEDVDSGGGTGFEVCTVAADCQHGAPGGTIGGAFQNVDGLAVDANGHVFAADELNHRVQEFTSSGAFVRAWGQGVDGGNVGSGFEVCTSSPACVGGDPDGDAGAMNRPSGIAVTADGHVLVADTYNNRVQEFSTSPGSVSFVRTWGKDVDSLALETGFEVCTVAVQCKAGEQGELGGELNLPTGIAVNGSSVYVSTDVQYRIQQFTPAGAFVRAWGKDVVAGNPSTGAEVCELAASCKNGEPGTGAGELFGTQIGNAIALSPGGDVYVADVGAHRIQVFDPAGAFLHMFGRGVVSGNPGYGVCSTPPTCQGGTTGGLGGEMNQPVAVAVGPDGAVYVADQFNSRMQKFATPVPASFRLSSATYSIDEDSGQASITVVRDGDPSGPVTVDYATVDGTADAGVDYTATAGTLTFAQGDTLESFAVPIVDDADEESDETVDVVLSDQTSGTVLGTPSAATLTIVDNDALDTAIIGGPTGPTNAPTANFVFTSPSAGATFECSLDGVPFDTCTSPYITPALPDGPHDLLVRARVGAGTDNTPAERHWFVDTKAPTSVVVLTPGASGTQLPGDSRYTGTVTAGVTPTDPAPSSGVSVTRCVLDPASPPVQFLDMPSCASPSTATPGLHTFYAASQDNAGNVEPVVVTRTFRIFAVPDTTITDGQSGDTWLKTPFFSFISSIPGSTFQCRIDATPFSSCATPYTSKELTVGAHSFEVRAVSPEGATDPTPARRDVNVLGGDTSRATCRIDPFLDLTFGVGDGPPPVGCWIATDHVGVERDCGSKGDFKCVDTGTYCPQWALCTVTVDTSWFDADKDTDWHSIVTLAMTASGNATCETGPNGDRCSARVTRTEIRTQPEDGYGRYSTICSATVVQGGVGVRGPDNVRRLSCNLVLDIQPASVLSAVASGSSVQILVPGAGTAVVGPGGMGRLAAGTAARLERKASFKPVTISAMEAGLVSFKPKLSKQAKQKLRKKGKLTLTLRSTFTPAAGGDVLSASSRVTLTRKTKLRVKLPALRSLSIDPLSW